MSSALHGIIGWVVLTIVVAAALHARAQVRSGRSYEGGLYRFAAVAVDIQVLIGIGVWAEGRWWATEDMFLQAWGHPVLALLAVGLVHAGVKKARGERWAAEAYGIAFRSLMGAAVLMAATAAIGIAA